MAITGTIDSLKKQIATDSNLSKALAYLSDTNVSEIFTKLYLGEKKVVEIDGKNIFAIFSKYLPKNALDAKFEAHLKYIDIQYMFEGEERILIADIDKIMHPEPYNEEKDIYFMEARNHSELYLSKDDAVIFFPFDLHAPSIKAIKSDVIVSKVVIKVSAE
ncbi:MAG: YhcH/YjgK/YiaL family protein [Bacteroidales bacterium]|nr:YhcH/YjgK/YiaL family protein [Bacteroidales bacterium]